MSSTRIRDEILTHCRHLGIGAFLEEPGQAIWVIRIPIAPGLPGLTLMMPEATDLLIAFDGLRGSLELSDFEDEDVDFTHLAVRFVRELLTGELRLGYSEGILSTTLRIERNTPDGWERERSSTSFRFNPWPTVRPSVWQGTAKIVAQS